MRWTGVRFQRVGRVVFSTREYESNCGRLETQRAPTIATLEMVREVAGDVRGMGDSYSRTKRLTGEKTCHIGQDVSDAEMVRMNVVGR